MFDARSKLDIEQYCCGSCNHHCHHCDSCQIRGCLSDTFEMYDSQLNNLLDQLINGRPRPSDCGTLYTLYSGWIRTLGVGRRGGTRLARRAWLCRLKPNTHRRRRRDETVESLRVGVGGVYMNSQLAHDDCRRIRWRERSRRPRSSLQFWS